MLIINFYLSFINNENSGIYIGPWFSSENSSFSVVIYLVMEVVMR